jgi:hypothetical protein
MKSLTKQQTTDRADIAARLRDAASDIESAVEKFNTATAKAKGELEAAVMTYNERMAEADEFRDVTVGDMQGHFDEKSEKWQESERGQAYLNWINEWEGAELGEVEIDFPNDLETPDLSAADVLEGLPDDPE